MQLPVFDSVQCFVIQECRLINSFAPAELQQATLEQKNLL